MCQFTGLAMTNFDALLVAERMSPNAVLEKFTSAVREAGGSRHNGGTIKDLSQTLQYDSAVVVGWITGEPSIGPP